MSAQLPAARQPVVVLDPKTGIYTLSRPWYLFFQSITESIGGPAELSTADLAVSIPSGGVEELRATVYVQSDVDALRTEISEIGARLFEAEKALNGFGQGVTL